MKQLTPEKIEKLIQIGQFCHQQNWVPATGGNLSLRLDEQAIAITVSGCHKGYLKPENIMTVDYNGDALNSDKRPSAETLLHTLIYQQYTYVNAVIHTHAPHATFISNINKQNHYIRLQDYELLKILRGINTHAVSVDIPIFDNDQDMLRLQGKVRQYLQNHSDPQAFILRGHGIYVWGETPEQAQYAHEALEALLQFEIMKLQWANNITEKAN